MADEKPQNETAPQLRRKPDLAAYKIETEAPAEPGPAAQEPVAEEPADDDAEADVVVPKLPNLVRPFHVEGIAVIDGMGVIVAVCGAAHHLFENKVAIADMLCSTLNRS